MASLSSGTEPHRPSAMKAAPSRQKAASSAAAAHGIGELQEHDADDRERDQLGGADDRMQQEAAPERVGAHQQDEQQDPDGSCRVHPDDQPVEGLSYSRSHWRSIGWF